MGEIGLSLSVAFEKHKESAGIMVQMFWWERDSSLVLS